MGRKNRAIAARPFSIRLTDGEKATLQEQAGRVPLGAYVRKMLLGDTAETRSVVAAGPAIDTALLARMLAALGQSDLGESLKTLARHADAGALECDEVTVTRLRQACDALLAMRLLLLHALGKRIIAETSQPSAANPEDWL